MENDRDEKIKIDGVRRVGVPETRPDRDTASDSNRHDDRNSITDEFVVSASKQTPQDQSERDETMVRTKRDTQLDPDSDLSDDFVTKVRNDAAEDKTVVHQGKSRKNIFTETLKAKPDRGQVKVSPWEKDRLDGARVYKIVGYTTVGKIDRKFYAERQQRFVRKLLTTVLVIALVVLLLLMLNPFKSFTDFRRILGLDSWYNDTNQHERIVLPEDPLSTSSPAETPNNR